MKSLSEQLKEKHALEFNPDAEINAATMYVGLVISQTAIKMNTQIESRINKLKLATDMKFLAAKLKHTEDGRKIKSGFLFAAGLVGIAMLGKTLDNLKKHRNEVSV